MKLIAEAKGYATVANAEKFLTKQLSRIDQTPDSVHHVITVNDAGRFVPTLVGQDNLTRAMQLDLAIIS